MHQKTYFTLTGLIFLIIAVLHLFRLAYGWEAQIGGWDVPMWLSVVAFLLSGFLSYSAFRLRG